MNFIDRLASPLAALRRDRRAATALVLGLSAIPVITMVAIAIDFSNAVTARSKLNLAADSGALAALNAAVNIFEQNQTASLQPAINVGLNRFNAQVGTISGTTVQAPSLTINRVGATFTANLTYTAAYSTNFAALLGKSTLNLGGESQMQISTSSYVDLQVVMDVSSSMLIGGTLTDINNLLTVTTPGSNFASPAASWWPTGCAFACHWDPNNNDFYHASRVNNITLRLDQLIAATDSIATTITNTNSLGLYRLGIYTFSTSIATLFPLSSTTSGAVAAVNGIQPPLGDPNAAYDTDITGSLTSFASKDLTTAGDGTTAAAPKKFVFLLTDGIEDVYKAGNPSNRVESAVNTSACTAIKNKGATLGVLHTDYYNPNNEFSEISGIQASVTAALQACASNATLYFEVSDQASITAAMQQLLAVAIATPTHFTQ